MSIMRATTVVLATILLAQPATAQTLLDKMSNSASKGADAVKKGVDNVGNTIDSTVELARGEPTPELTRERLDAMADDALQRLYAENPDAKDLFDLSAGYAVFDTRRAALFGVSAGFGRGVAVSNITDERTYMNMGTGGLGFAFGIGGFESQLVVLFEDETLLETFVEHGYDATAESGAVMGDDKADQTVRFVDGRSIFVLGKKGWRVSATATGTKYWPAEDLN